MFVEIGFKIKNLHLKGERYSRNLKPLNFKVYAYGGLVVSFEYIFTKPAKKQKLIFYPSDTLTQMCLSLVP